MTMQDVATMKLYIKVLETRERLTNAQNLEIATREEREALEAAYNRTESRDDLTALVQVCKLQDQHRATVNRLSKQLDKLVYQFNAASLEGHGVDQIHELNRSLLNVGGLQRF